ncbi:MAG: hypothetical protein ACUVV3_05175 [Dehalococcoidia bacterium]
MPRVEAIFATYYLKVQPGPPLDNPGVLTCGWHTGACPNDAYVAIDWDDYGGNQAYWRSYLYMQYAQHGTVVAWGYSTQYDTPSCYRTRLRVVHYLSGQSMGRVYYTHTHSNGATIGIKGSGSSWSDTKGQIGTIVTSEKTQGCDWEGAHIHQGDDDNLFSHKNPTFPMSTQCHVPWCTQSVNTMDPNKWQFYRAGQIQYWLPIGSRLVAPGGIYSLTVAETRLL